MNSNNNDDDTRYQSKIDEKLIKDNVKTIVRTANKLLELQVTLSRCCEWLNELDMNITTAQDPLLGDIFGSP